MRFTQGPDSEIGQEKRIARRFAMKLSASVRVRGVPVAFTTETENVSSRGIFFYMDRRMEEGARLEVTMAFPPQVTLTDSVRVKFLARVVRVFSDQPAARLGNAAVGVAAVIEEYEFLRSSDAEDSSGIQPGWKISS